MERLLNITDANLLAGVIHAAQYRRPVARAIDEKVVYATANIIVADTAEGFMAIDTDVRDAYLKVVLQDGTVAYWSVAELMTDSLGGKFIANYQGTHA